MPTTKRQIYDEAACHIIQRGNNRQALFKEREDFEKFLSLIREYKLIYPFELYNYCLMRNHLHLLIKILKGDDLKKVMQGVFQSFRFYFRKKYGYTGYLYQGRYKSKIIQKDAYLLECARYIERNPLRAGVVENLIDYEWTSYNFYAYGASDRLLTVNPLYNSLSSDDVRRKELYKEYVSATRLYEEFIDKEFKIKQGN
jgi:putative transposase